MTNSSIDKPLLGQKFKALTLNDSFMQSSIMDYVNSLPHLERKILKEELEYNRDLYKEFNFKLYNFFSLYFIENSPHVNNDYQEIIENIKTNNPHIQSMYKYHADGHMTPLAQMIENKTVPFISSIITKTLLAIDLLQELKNQPKSTRIIKL